MQQRAKNRVGIGACIASPRHNLVRPDQRIIGFVQVVSLRHVDDGKVYVVLSGRLDEGKRRSVGTGAKHGPFKTKCVV